MRVFNQCLACFKKDNRGKVNAMLSNEYLQKIHINIHIQYLMLDSEGGLIGFSFFFE
jgi:hypothetical protein